MATVLRGSDNFDSASGFNSVGTLKAWVSFNGQGTVAIRAGVNVSSITDHGTGQYTVSFSTAMPDVKYIMSQTVGNGISIGGNYSAHVGEKTVSSQKIYVNSRSAARWDPGFAELGVFR